LIVFLWIVFAALLWREWSFARSRGIVVTAQNWRTEWPRLKRFRTEDPEARRLYGLLTKWLRITLVMWVVGFVVLGSALFVFDRAGILVGPHSRRGGSEAWSNFTVEQTAGSHSLAAAAHRERYACEAHDRTGARSRVRRQERGRLFGKNSVLRKEGQGVALARCPQAQRQSNGGRGHPQRPLRSALLRPRRAGSGGYPRYLSQGNCCRGPETTVLFVIVPQASQPGGCKEKG